MVITLEVIVETIDQIMILEEHAEVFEQITIFEKYRSIHVVKSFLNILPEPRQQVLILKQNAFLVVVLHQFVEVCISRLGSLERHAHQLSAQFVLEVSRILKAQNETIEALEQPQLVVSAEVV